MILYTYYITINLKTRWTFLGVKLFFSPWIDFSPSVHLPPLETIPPFSFETMVNLMDLEKIFICFEKLELRLSIWSVSLIAIPRGMGHSEGD